jgi:hypothetical protein
MGLSIHYKGNFKKSASLIGMIEEVKDIAGVHKWDFFVFEKEFPEMPANKDDYNEEVYGICFSPPDCEPVFLSFLSNRRMSSFVNLDFWGKHKNKKEEKKYLYSLHTKTQFSGLENHKLIIHLLRYLSKKYLTHFKLVDEGQYWETGDENVISKSFEDYENLFAKFYDSLDNIPIEKGESIESYLKRIAKNIEKK